MFKNINVKHSVVFLTVCLCTVSFVNAQKNETPGNQERQIKLSIDIETPIDKVWKQWTTPQGISRFFAPASQIEIRPLGKFDIYFTPNQPVGFRGAEGNLIMSVQEERMLSFTWDAPPQWPEIRKQRTFVTLRFKKLAEDKTEVSLVHTGWGGGAEWDAVFSYFESAWGKTVLPFLKYSFEVGPVNWTDFPKNVPKGLAAARRL